LSSSESGFGGDSINRFALEISYIGTRFDGWQTQKSGNSIQQHIERAAGIIFRKPCQVIGASRTDAGVHAVAQYAIIDSEYPISEVERLRLSFNAILPDEIKIMRIIHVDGDFHPIRNSYAKLYSYRIWRGRFASPFWAQYSWNVNFELNIANILAEAQSFVGEHDFASFCAVDSSARTTKRTILGMRVTSAGEMIVFEILGIGFLKQMCRSMVGTLVDVGRGKLSPGSVKQLLDLENRAGVGQTAPAQGLCLEKVYFEPIKLDQIPVRVSLG
jgi:tRNA pseudouridine38-40 synthase